MTSTTATQGPGRVIEKAPHRQFSRPSLPVGVVSVRADVPKVAERTLARVKEVRRARSCGTLVFADPDGKVYALRSESVSADNMSSSHPEWLVCEYSGRHRDGSVAACPALADIEEDLAFHFDQIGKELRDTPEQFDLWGFHGAFAEALCYLAGRRRHGRSAALR